MPNLVAMKKDSKISKDTHTEEENSRLLQRVSESLEMEHLQAKELRKKLKKGENSPLIAHFHPKNHLAQIHAKYLK